MIRDPKSPMPEGWFVVAAIFAVILILGLWIAARIIAAFIGV